MIASFYKKHTRMLGVLLLCFVGLTGLLANQDLLPVGVTYVRTQSIPVGFYWHTTKSQRLALMDQACFPYVAPEWAKPRQYFPEGMLLCKYIYGVAGDRLVRDGDQLRICHKSECVDIGKVHQHDSHGRAVQAARLPDVIPDGYVFVGSPATMSFDSRYIGLISTHDFKRTIHPILTWGGVAK